MTEPTGISREAKEICFDSLSKMVDSIIFERLKRKGGKNEYKNAF